MDQVCKFYLHKVLLVSVSIARTKLEYRPEELVHRGHFCLDYI